MARDPFGVAMASPRLADLAPLPIWRGSRRLARFVRHVVRRFDPLVVDRFPGQVVVVRRQGHVTKLLKLRHDLRFRRKRRGAKLEVGLALAGILEELADRGVRIELAGLSQDWGTGQDRRWPGKGEKRYCGRARRALGLDSWGPRCL